MAISHRPAHMNHTTTTVANPMYLLISRESSYFFAWVLAVTPTLAIVAGRR